MTRYALAQINLTVGALQKNAEAILRALEQASAYQPDLIVFPELTLAGYPPEDLLLRDAFLEACAEEMERLIPKVKGTALIGFPRFDMQGNRYNSAGLVRDGVLYHTYDKCLLPNYSVFDEERYFQRGAHGMNIEFNGTQTGVVICEDAWEDIGPAADEAAAGAGVIACLSASPFHRNKNAVREETFRRLCTRSGVYFLYCNLVGGHDELVFDGGSLVMDPDGEVIARAKEFEEDLLIVDLPDQPSRPQEPAPNDRMTRGVSLPPMSRQAKPEAPTPGGEKLSLEAEVYGALCLGLGDYIRKNGFRGCIIGLSGGIDSALTAAIAVDALGAENVIGVTMPSQYSSEETRSDAEILANNLGIRFVTLPITAPYDAYSKLLAPHFAGVESDPENLTDQNLQARIRAVYLMALSNKFGMLVINTSNKSESATGYGTLYGDMVGGYAAIKDVLKTQVWELSYYVNTLHGREVIPVSTIERVPSAELRPDQEDRHSLPDYPILDPILELYVEKDLGVQEIIQRGHDPEEVRRVIRLVDRAEFKRRQAVLGTRITPKAFGKDRRMPITNGFG